MRPAYDSDSLFEVLPLEYAKILLTSSAYKYPNTSTRTSVKNSRSLCKYSFEINFIFESNFTWLNSKLRISNVSAARYSYSKINPTAALFKMLATFISAAEGGYPHALGGFCNNCALNN